MHQCQKQVPKSETENLWYFHVNPQIIEELTVPALHIKSNTNLSQTQVLNENCTNWSLVMLF